MMSEFSQPTMNDAETGLMSPGAQLQAARERAGWPVERLAAELCLPLDRMRALEADQHAGFGGAVFVRGYLRRAAGLLDIPPQELIAAYESCCGGARPTEVLPGPAPGKPPRREVPGWVGSLAGGIAVAAALGLTWWLMGPNDTTSPAAGVDAPDALEFVVADTAPAATTEPAAREIGASDSEERPAPAGTPATDPAALAAAETPDVAVDAEPEPGLPSEAVAVSAVAEQAQPEQPEQPQQRVVQAPEPAMPPPGTVELRIEFTEDCWLEVFDAEERRLAYRLHRSGDVARLRGTAPLAVFLGNAEGVRLTVDGTPIAVRPAARRDGTARLMVGGGAG